MSQIRSASMKKTLGSMIYEVVETSLHPPERITVTEAAVKYVRLNNPGSYSGPFDIDQTPYMREPMDTFASREKQGLIFVGPSQSSKTASLCLNTIAYNVICDPMDMIIYEKSQNAAKDFSIRRVDRLHRDSPEVQKMLLNFGKSGDNVFDKKYKNGVLLSLSYPAINEMSGRPVPRVVLTDYDRMPQDVDGEGTPFDVGRARIRTFRSAGKIVAESSPSFDLLDPHWKPQAKHDGPPVQGIVGLYNRGDRRRWYWPCPHCGEFFEGTFKLLEWDENEKDILKASHGAYMRCPMNGCVINFEHRYEMNLKGKWLGAAQKVVNGEIVGREYPSNIASFWLKGTAAAFSTWQSLVQKWLEAKKEYDDSGNQLPMKTTTNTDQAEVWTPLGTETITTPEELMDEAIDEYKKREVPLSVRFLLAQIDVQGGHWVVQVFGVQPSDVGLNYDFVYIDRFKIDRSERVNENGDREYTRPSAHPEDWDLITKQVLDKTYPLENGEGHMPIWHTVCDSGGKGGATSNAYAYWLRLRKEGRHNKFLLLKGDSNINSPRVHVEMPDAQRKDRLAQARGEIPIIFMNSNVLKDVAHGMLMRKSAGGRVYTPSWFKEDLPFFYRELTVEVRTPKGWVNPQKKRNEAWDLLYYGIGQCLHWKLDKVAWDHPPTFALPWESNPLILRELPDGKEVAKSERPRQSLASLAKELG